MSGSQHNSLIDSLENSPMDPGYQHHHENYDPIIVDQLRYEKTGFGSAHSSETDQSAAAAAFLDDFKNKSRFAEDFVSQFSPVEEEPSTNVVNVNVSTKSGSGGGFLAEDSDVGSGGGSFRPGGMNGHPHHSQNQYEQKHVYTSSTTISGGSTGGGSFPGGKIHSPTGGAGSHVTPAGHVTADFDPTEEFTYARTGPLLVGNPVILKPEPDSLSEIPKPHHQQQKDDFDWSVSKPKPTNQQPTAPPAANVMPDFDPIFADLGKKQEQKQPDQKTGSVTGTVGTGTGSATVSKQWANSAASTDNFFSLKRLNPKLLDLIYWRDWRKSAIFFVPIFSLLLCLALFSFISVFAYAGLVLIAVSLSLRLFAVLSSYFGAGKRPVSANNAQAQQPVVVGGEAGLGGGDGQAAKNPLEPYLKTSLHLNEEEVHKQLDGALKQWNRSVEKLRSLLLSENLFDTAKLAAVLWLLTYVGACISFTALIVIAFVALFTLPKFYEVYKEPIDRYYALAESKAKHVAALINEKKSQLINKKKPHGE